MGCPSPEDLYIKERERSGVERKKQRGIERERESERVGGKGTKKGREKKGGGGKGLCIVKIKPVRGREGCYAGAMKNELERNKKTRVRRCVCSGALIPTA